MQQKLNMIFFIAIHEIINIENVLILNCVYNYYVVLIYMKYNQRGFKKFRGGESEPLAFTDPALLKALEGKGFREDIEKKLGRGFMEDVRGKLGKGENMAPPNSIFPSNEALKAAQSMKKTVSIYDPTTNVALLYGQDTYKVAAPIDIPQDGGADDLHAEYKKTVEKAYAEEAMKGGGQVGGGFFSSLGSAFKSAGSVAGKAFGDALNIKPTDSLLEAFVKGVKAPLTIGKKFEQKTGIKLSEAALKAGEALAIASVGNPTLSPIAAGLVAAGGAGKQVGLGHPGGFQSLPTQLQKDLIKDSKDPFKLGGYP